LKRTIPESVPNGDVAWICVKRQEGLNMCEIKGKAERGEMRPGPVTKIRFLYCHVLSVYRWGFGLTVGFIAHLQSLTTESLRTVSQLTTEYLTITTDSQLSLCDVLSGWQPHLWHPLPSLNSSA
jgi:hypothetical protein